jgi:hypothetical protein
MATIQAKHYETARRVLMNDLIVQDMAGGLRDVPLNELQHEDGTPRFEFMQAANNEYDRRGGTNHAHIGAVAEALLTLILTEEKMNTTTTTTRNPSTKTSRYNPKYAREYRNRKAALREDAEFELYNVYELDADELEFDVDFDNDTTN